MSPSRVQHFTGRTFELQQLKSKLASDNEHRVMSICGLGGCGKTSLAIEFSWLFRSCYPGGVFWISAENSDSFTNSVNQFAREIGISGKDFTETYALSLKWLATLSSRWLLVIDNMDQYEVPDNVKKLLQEHWRRTCKGHLLVTTRRSVIEMTEIYSGALKTEDCLQMNCLSTDESVSFMSRRTQKEIFEDQEAVTNLATELGGLPLALEQAAAYIKRLDCTFREYLEQFRIQRLKLLKKRVTSSSTMSKERLTVTTTWSMNFEYITEMSEEEGYGKSAAVIMEVSAFFAADDIPLQAINVGFPAVRDKDLEETLELPLGSKQILEILTRFSLFQSYGRETYSVHRLVQEVIRGRLDKESVGERLEIGIRMLHKAIKDTVNPTDLLYRVSGSGMANDLSRLHLWGKLAHQVCVLIEHIEQFVRDGSASASDFINLEVATIFHEASVFHSVNKRHAKALDLQNKKNKILAAVHDVDDSQVNELTMIKIPLNDKDQTKLQNAMKGDDVNVGGKTGGPNKNSNKTSDDLRERGNSAFKGGNHHEAIKWYTNAICVNDSDSRLYNNRSLCHFKLNNFENALTDADESIKLDRNKYKAFARRAFALNGLAEQSSPGMEKTFFESSGHAAASIAAFLHPPCNLEYDMKISYPILVFKEIRNDSELLETLTSKFTQPNTTLLLHPGEYRYCQIGYQDVRIVGIHTGVTLNCTSDYIPVPLPAEAEPFICHFENLTFKGMSFLVHLQGKTCSFYNCKFSNGEPACDNFPKCDGVYGCRQPNVCSQQQAESPGDWYNLLYQMKPIGRCGYPGLQVSQNSTVFLHRCVFERCGGGGLLVDGIGSKAYVQHCIFRRNRQHGLEVRNQGKMYVEHCDIEMNQMHGVAIGPEAEYCYLNDNKIIGNYKEGVFLRQSCGIIVNNVIGQNYACGISVDHLNKVAVRGNRIFDNWHWGILIQGLSSAFVQANEIFQNKCGGIQISANASARAVIDANTIRGHTGPALYTKSFCVPHKLDKIEMPDGMEIEFNSSPPIVTDRNTLMHNDMGKQHPKEQSKSLFQVCAHCYGRPAGPNKLLRCSACKQAYYCSDKCSELHWVRHKDFCHILQGCNFITVKIPPVENRRVVRTINPGLAKIGHTPPPKKGDTFIVKIQGGPDYMTYNPNVPVGLYDRSMTIDFFFVHPEIYHIIMECGVLCTTMFSCKKIFCWATYTDKGKSIRIQTDVLAPFQKW
ncbi:uncharacterized protein [Ptychodera flava]|uniref:uncharacterized protein n=1 Tax=Ptychodera flava TaxID=63121 RepID=UPI003969EE4E